MATMPISNTTTSTSVSICPPRLKGFGRGSHLSRRRVLVLLRVTTSSPRYPEERKHPELHRDEEHGDPEQHPTRSLRQNRRVAHCELDPENKRDSREQREPDEQRLGDRDPAELRVDREPRFGRREDPAGWRALVDRYLFGHVVLVAVDILDDQ